MSEQSQLGPSDDGSVMIDIGGDIGALVLHTGPDLLLAEIEISRLDGARPLAPGFDLPGEHTHSHSHGADLHGHAHDHDQAHDHGHAPGHGVDDEPVRTHVAVRERRGPSGTRYAAIYPGLYTGDYQLWRADGAPGGVVTIVGGQVAELDWR